MTLNNNTQGANPEANPVDGADIKPQVTDEGNLNQTEPQLDNQSNNNEGKAYTQKQLDDIAAKARGNAERETKKKLLAELGLRADEEDKLLAFKEAYEASLS